MAEIAREKGIKPAAIEVWFADEARVGQKNKITRRWAKRGTRPAAPTDQRTASTYIFGAICPALGKGAALILPHRNTRAMNLHLAEIAQAIEPGAHAVLLVDQAGWHLSHRLIVPPNMSIVPMPPKCPELNPVENIWQYMRGNWLSNRVFQSYTNIVDHCCDAWNKLIAQPWTIMSVGLRHWAYGFSSTSAGISPDDVSKPDGPNPIDPARKNRRLSLLHGMQRRRMAMGTID